MSAEGVPPRALRPRLLYARSRALPVTLASLLAVAALAAWSADWLQGLPGFDHEVRVPVIFLSSLLASAAIGTSLHSPSDELDRTAVRPWWTRRLGHLGALTALAAGLLAAAVPGHPEAFGAPAMVRDVLGATGLAAAGAVALGARLSWLPMTAYGSAAYLSAPRAPGGFAAVWAWPVQPGPEAGAWAAALVACAVGGGLYVWRGARPGSP